MKLVPRLVYRIARLWWSIARPITVGVRVLMIREGRVLLVRHTYQAAWYLPGGGVKRGETLAQAIRREAAEEVGATLEELGLFGVYSNFYEAKSDHVVVFDCHAFALSGNTDREIERFALFALDDLPGGVSPGTGRRIREYRQRDAPYFGPW